jgi:hypothetical protein
VTSSIISATSPAVAPSTSRDSVSVLTLSTGVPAWIATQWRAEI